MVQLKENAEGPETGRKIRSLLVPREYTRLDEMVDVMFTTAKDVERVIDAVDSEQVQAAEDTPEKVKGAWEFTDSKMLQAKRDEIIRALSSREGVPLIKKSRALYWSPDHQRRAGFTISKHYARRGGPHYWYAYHTQWDEFLQEAERGYLVLGCMDRDHAFAIPTDVFRLLMEDLNTTRNEDGTYYWHIQLTEDAGDVSLIVPKRKNNLPLSEYRLKLQA